MYFYAYIEAKTIPQDQWQFLMPFFEAYIDIVSVDKKDKTLCINYQSQTPLDLKDMLYHIISETYQDIRLYQSHHFDDLNSLQSHQTYMTSIMSLIPFNLASYLDDKICLKYLLQQNIVVEKKHFLRKYASNSEILLTVKTFLEHNQNINQTAAELYIHRNTLLQRLDKFHHMTGFDLKKFQDAFIMYQII